jgi:hypothetical protein
MLDGQGILEGLEMQYTRRDSVGRGPFVGQTPRLHADEAPQVRVTLSVDLLNHLRTESQSRHIPLRWLVAGLVCDTMNTDVKPSSEHEVRPGRSRASAIQPQKTQSALAGAPSAHPSARGS